MMDIVKALALDKHVSYLYEWSMYYLCVLAIQTPQPEP